MTATINVIAGLIRPAPKGKTPDTFDNQAAINRPAKSVLGDFLLSRAVVPSAGFFERGKFGNDHAFDFRSFQRHMPPICGQDFDRATFQCRADFGPLAFQLRLVERLFSYEHHLFVEPRLKGNLDVVSVRVADVCREVVGTPFGPKARFLD